MSPRALLFIIVAIIAAAAATDVIAVADNPEPGFYRELIIAGSPSLEHIQNGTATAIAVAGIGLNVSQASTWEQGQASIDIAGFKFRNPEDTSDSSKNLLFYFGYFGASAAWDNSSKTASLTGSLLEVVATFSSVIVYYDNDNVPGFQVIVGDDILCVDPSKSTIDCVDLKAGSAIDISALAWNGIAVSKSACPQTGSYSPNCTVYSATTGTKDGIISFTLHLASEPVLINSVKVTPNYGKIDVSINYPWADKTLAIPEKAKVALIAGSAGKALSGSATWAKVDGNTAVAFNANNKAAYFSWVGTSDIDNGVNAVVHAQGISGDQLAALDCSDYKCGLSGIYIYPQLQIAAGTLKAFGWTPELIIFSWDAIKPTNIVWDPTLGMTSQPVVAAVQGSSGSVVAPSVFLAVALIVAKLF